MATIASIRREVSELAAGLTRQRVRGHAAILGVIVWGVYVFSLATPGLRDRFRTVKGADFLHFYVLGWIARHHLGSLLYGFAGQTELARQLVPEAAGKLYLPVYGPQFSLLFAPFAGLPYGWAAAAWMLTSALMYGLCCYAIWRVCRNLRGEGSTVLVLALAFPGFFSLIGGGQNSALALGAFTAAFFSLRAKRPLLAGLAIGLLAYKPQFGLMAALVFLFTFEWKIILGALISGVGQFAIAAWYYGTAVIGGYFRNLAWVNQYAVFLEPSLFKMHSLRAFWQCLLPWPRIAFVLYVASAVWIVIVTLRYWKSAAPLPLRFAVFLLGSVLIDPHLTDYDLVVLAPALLLIGNWIMTAAPSCHRDAAKLLTYAAYALPAFGALLKFTHVQFSVIAFTALLLVLVKSSAAASNTAASPEPTAGCCRASWGDS
jgi:glycosyl transferase family 87